MVGAASQSNSLATENSQKKAWCMVNIKHLELSMRDDVPDTYTSNIIHFVGL